MTDILRQNPLALVAFFALLVSAGSLFVATRMLRQQREHNYKSVRPIAHISRGDYINCIFIKLKNYGSGPLLVDSFTIEARDSIHKRMIDALGPVAERHCWDSYTDTIDGRALAPKEEFILLKGTFSETEHNIRDAVRKSLSEMTLKIEYSDVYDRKQPILVEKLTWFSRR